MKNFITYLYEANSAGSQFELCVADNVEKWIKLNDLDDKYSAERFLTVSEDNGNRDEDYSDVIVHNLLNESAFFIECKTSNRDNVINPLFDIIEGCHLIPVKKVARKESKSESLLNLALLIEESNEWKEFSNFMTTTDETGKTFLSYWLDLSNVDEKLLIDAIVAYNGLVDDGKVESDNKKFDARNIRDTTKNQLYVALNWRLADESHTWDICHVKDIPDFGQMIADHYMYGKADEVKYILISYNCFKFADDPLKTGCKTFPTNAVGQIDLKFTPRFGVGGMYMTPRAKLTTKLSSNFTFAKGK